MKIVYVVSSLKRTGPTQQLLNILRFLQKCEVTVITLSKEPSDTLLSEFLALNVNILSLNLSRLSSFFSAKKSLKKYISEIGPNIIHTQGIRADRLLSQLTSTDYFWVSTIRNVPTIDYPAKFGRIIGRIMALSHISSLKKCVHLVSCSKSVKTALSQLGVSSFAIQNGVFFHEGVDAHAGTFEHLASPVFVSVGGLISRKNVVETITAFEIYKTQHHGTGTLLIVGEGPERYNLESKFSVDDLIFLGQSDQVAQILSSSSYFVSSSLSEGLPNTVLEAMSAGLPVLLSDIPSHQEIFCEAEQSVRLYNSVNPSQHLAELMYKIEDVFDENAGAKGQQVAFNKFSAEIMATSYQNFYKELCTNVTI